MRWSINAQWGADYRTTCTRSDEGAEPPRRVRALPERDLVGPRPREVLQDAAIKRLMTAAKRVRNSRRGLAQTGGDWRVELIKMAKTEYLMRPPQHELGPGLESYVAFKGDAIAEPHAKAPSVDMLERLPPELSAKYADIDLLVVPRETLQAEARESSISSITRCWATGPSTCATCTGQRSGGCGSSVPQKRRSARLP